LVSVERNLFGDKGRKEKKGERKRGALKRENQPPRRMADSKNPVPSRTNYFRTKRLKGMTAKLIKIMLRRRHVGGEGEKMTGERGGARTGKKTARNATATTS